MSHSESSSPPKGIPHGRLEDEAPSADGLGQQATCLPPNHAGRWASPAMSFSYADQTSSEEVARAFVGDAASVLMLGDNILYGARLRPLLGPGRAPNDRGGDVRYRAVGRAGPMPRCCVRFTCLAYKARCECALRERRLSNHGRASQTWVGVRRVGAKYARQRGDQFTLVGLMAQMLASTVASIVVITR